MELMSRADVERAVGAGVMTSAGFPRPWSTGPGGSAWRTEDVDRWQEANRPAPAAPRKQTRPKNHAGAQTRPAE